MPGSNARFSPFIRLKTLFDNAMNNTMVLMDNKGIIITVNNAFVKCFGYTPGDVAGKNFSIFFTEEDQRKGRPQKELEEVLREGHAADNNYLVSKDKAITWVSGESVLVQNNEGTTEIVKIIQNIHEQKEGEIALQKLNKFNEDILWSIADLVVVLGPGKKVTMANRAFLTIFSLQNQDVLDVDFSEVVSPFDATDEICKNLDKAVETNTGFSNKPVEIETSSGEKRVFEISCTIVERNSHGNHFLLVMHDITVHKKMEREREDIIGFVAHELRNPLANLVLTNELIGELIKENKIEEISDLLQRSRNNVSRLNKMIAELYDATKINSGKLKLDMSTFNFGEMIRDAIDTIEVLQPSYNIVLHGEMDIQVRGDRYRLIQVVTNYLSNGIKYSNGNTDVTLTVSHDDKTITVAVKDEGLGISQDQLPYIFNRFFRAEKTRNLEGIGLGLYLCRQIIHAHNGSVWAESEEGTGSVFYFKIPL